MAVKRDPEAPRLSRKASWLAHGKRAGRKAPGGAERGGRVRSPREGPGLQHWASWAGEELPVPHLAGPSGSQAWAPHELPDLGGVPGAEEGAESQPHP